MHVDAEKKQIRGARTSGISLIVVEMRRKVNPVRFLSFTGLLFIYLIFNYGVGRMNYD